MGCTESVDYVLGLWPQLDVFILRLFHSQSAMHAYSIMSEAQSISLQAFKVMYTKASFAYLLCLPSCRSLCGSSTLLLL